MVAYILRWEMVYRESPCPPSYESVIILEEAILMFGGC
jgi:hypothetical protein